MKESKPVDEMNYEEAFAELEAIVSLLESGDKPLEETLKAYGRGQLLYKRCGELLEKADLQVRQVSGEMEKTLEDE